MDAGAFRAFEHQGWQGVVDQYDQGFGPLTTQAIGPLLDAAGVRTGIRVLDVASGPGYVTAAAMARGADAVGLDFSAAMLMEARRRHPAADFREGDADAMPFPDHSFDAVVMNFGLLHLARPEQAIREAHRVVRPGGRFAFTVWAPPEQAVAFGIVLHAVRSCGNPEVSLPEGPPFFRFSQPAECVRALREAGFEAPQTTGLPQVWRLSSGEALS